MLADYDNKIYPYENDVLYGYSIRAYYRKGSKFYVVTKYNLLKNADIWLRIAHTYYADRNIVKSGWDEAEGNKMIDVKLQLRYKF